MKLFFAGAEAFPLLLKKYNANMLMSYYHIPGKYRRNPKIKEQVGMDKNQLLFIDSGAFSAFTLMEEIKLDDYIAWCKKTDADYYAVYDAIGSAEKTLVNQKYMEEQGVTPVPCFHYGEDFSYLKYYTEHYDFVAIGGMVPIARNKLDKWLDRLFNKYPNHKFHGFRLTTNWLVQKYPWYSVDSSSWIMGGRTKMLFDIELGTCRSDKIHRSSKWLNLLQQRNIKLDELASDKRYDLRLEFNIQSYLEMQNKHNLLTYKPDYAKLSRW